MVMWVRNTEREKRELRKVKKSIGGVERMRVGFKCQKNSSNYVKKKKTASDTFKFLHHTTVFCRLISVTLGYIFPCFLNDKRMSSQKHVNFNYY